MLCLLGPSLQAMTAFLSLDPYEQMLTAQREREIKSWRQEVFRGEGWESAQGFLRPTKLHIAHSCAQCPVRVITLPAAHDGTLILCKMQQLAESEKSQAMQHLC